VWLLLVAAPQAVCGQELVHEYPAALVVDLVGKITYQ
jgi:hypothetical protein